MAAKRKIKISMETIDSFLADLRDQGRAEGSCEIYRYVLRQFYEFLPEDKYITADTPEMWRAWLVQKGCSQRTLDSRTSMLNSFLKHIDRREWRVKDFYSRIGNPQDGLTRDEYLRLLTAAKALRKEKIYLLIKAIGCAGIHCRELPQLTIEAVKAGTVHFIGSDGLPSRSVHLPRSYRLELLDYADRKAILSGPVFLGHSGAPISRSAVHYDIRTLSAPARVEPKKANPRCLMRMYQVTLSEFKNEVGTVVSEQSYEHMTEQEQLSVGWNI